MPLSEKKSTLKASHSQFGMNLSMTKQL